MSVKGGSTVLWFWHCSSISTSNDSVHSKTNQYNSSLCISSLSGWAVKPWLITATGAWVARFLRYKRFFGRPLPLCQTGVWLERLDLTVKLSPSWALWPYKGTSLGTRPHPAFCHLQYGKSLGRRLQKYLGKSNATLSSVSGPKIRGSLCLKNLLYLLGLGFLKLKYRRLWLISACASKCKW